MENLKTKPTSEPAGDGTVSAKNECTLGSRQVSAEEQKRHQAFLAFVRAKEDAWATMSPEERAEAEAAWEATVKNINDARAGHRKVFVG